MRGLVDDMQRCELIRLLNALAAADPKPVLTAPERETLRDLWRRLTPITTADLDLVRQIHSRIKHNGESS